MPPTPLDLSLLAAGRHDRVWRFLGAHPQPGGSSFAVWAPRAGWVAVAVAGLPPAPMTRLDGGVWYAYVPGAGPGMRYRYRIRGTDGIVREKADPVAAYGGEDSVIYTSSYEWGPAFAAPELRSVYEVHLGSWRPGLSYRELAHQLAAHVTRLGFSHVEFLPVMEHPYGGSWGYQVTGFFAPTARFGTPDDFRYLVDHLHRHGIGVLLDWVPAHFARDDWALARFDGAALYEPADPARAEHPDWGSLVFDYGRPEVRSFLISSALYWCEEFRVDGLRVDAVASMLYLDYSRASGAWEPNIRGGNENLDAVGFVRDLVAAVGRHRPAAILIAEDSTSWPGVTRPARDGGLGFGYKWSLGWMHDTLTALSREPADRDRLALPGTYAADERFVLPLSHDEVVHGKGSLTGKLPGDRATRVAGLRGLLGYMWAFPGRKLVFMGTELAPDTEWSEADGLDWSDADPRMQKLLTDLNRVYRAEPALYSQDDDPAGFAWLALEDTAVALLRRGVDGSLLASVTNLSGTRLPAFRVPLPVAGRWAEVINTDAVDYAGTGVGNLGAVLAAGSPAGAYVQLGARATVWLTYVPE